MTNQFDLTPASAYWLGAILTDGYLQHIGYQRRVCISVVDRDFVDAVNDACEEMMGRRYSVIPRRPSTPRSQPQWLLQMSNARLYEWALQETEGKLRVPRQMFEAPMECQEAFAAGMMDGDGWISVCWKPKPHSSLSSFVQVGIASCDPWLDDFKRLCDNMGLPTGPIRIIKRNNPNWREIRRFHFKPQPFIERALPLKIARKRDKIAMLMRHCESSEAIRSACV